MVKKLVILLFYTCSSLGSSAQVYFTYGYGSNFSNVHGLNQFVASYNDTRPWLDKELKSFAYVDGFVVNFGAGIGPGWVEFEYAFRAQKRSAEGIGTGNAFIRDVKLKQPTFAISSGIIFVENEGGVSLGLRTEFGKMKVKTRVYENASDKPDWDTYDLGLKLNTGPVLKIFIAPEADILGTLSIYYTFGLLKNNVYEIEEDINHTSPTYKDERFQNSNGLFGFSFAFGVFGS